MRVPDSRFFAIGMKGFVELREDIVVPKRVESRAESIMEKRNPYYSPWNPNSNQKKFKPVKVVLIQVTFEGGETIKTMKSRAFTAKTGVTLKNGSMVELPPYMLELLKESK